MDPEAEICNVEYIFVDCSASLRRRHPFLSKLGWKPSGNTHRSAARLSRWQTGEYAYVICYVCRIRLSRDSSSLNLALLSLAPIVGVLWRRL